MTAPSGTGPDCRSQSRHPSTAASNQVLECRYMNAPRTRSAMVPVLAQALLALFAVAAPAVGQAPDKCTASGVMGRERFVLQHCMIAFEEDSKSVTVWLNAHPISTKEAEQLRTSAF